MCAIHCTNANDNLTTLESLLAWKVMLKAAKIRSYAPVLNLVISELNVFPVGVKYHRKCYQSFTHKLHLGKLSENQSKYSYKIKETLIDYLQN